MTPTNQPPNETMALMLKRASCRSFTDEPIAPDMLRQILETGIHAATAGNLQPYSIIQVEDPKTREQLAELCGEQAYIAKAPVNLLFCIDWNRLKRWAEFEMAPFAATHSFRHFWLSFEDTIVCAQTICTAADAVALGSVYIGTILECFAELRELFDLPEGVLPVVLLCLGHPKSRPKPARKLGTDIVVHQEKYCQIPDEQLAAAFDEKYRGREREISEERVGRIAEVCQRVHGKQFADDCVKQIREHGFISAAQTYFGLNYCADTMPEDNDTFLEIMDDFGFDWFKVYRPPGEKEA